MIFDSHAHYDDEAFDKDRDRLLSTLEEQGVGCIVNVGASFQGAKDSVELSMRYPHVYAAVGVHPDHVGELDEAKMQQLREMCAMKKQSQSARSVLIITGIKSRTSFRRNGLNGRWSLQKR